MYCLLPAEAAPLSDSQHSIRLVLDQTFTGLDFTDLVVVGSATGVVQGLW